MVAFLEKVDPTSFGQIPLLAQALHSFSDMKVTHLLSNLSQVFLKHGVNNEFGLTMVHRHFEMGSNEILVESVKDDLSMSVSVPWKVQGGDALPSDEMYWNSFGLKLKQNVVPQSWGFGTEDGDLSAFEYLATDDENMATYLPPPLFTAELLALLKKYKIHKMVGLRRIHNPGKSSWEITPAGIRANVREFGTSTSFDQQRGLSEQKMIIVSWRFDDDGNLRGNDGCYDCEDMCCSSW